MSQNFQPFGARPFNGPAAKVFHSGPGSGSTSSENRPPLATLQNNHQQQIAVPGGKVASSSSSNVLVPFSQKPSQAVSSSRVPFSALQPSNPRLQPTANYVANSSDNNSLGQIRAFGRPLNNSLAKISISRAPQRHRHHQQQPQPRLKATAVLAPAASSGSSNRRLDEESSVRVLPPSPKRLKLRQSWSR